MVSHTGDWIVHWLKWLPAFGCCIAWLNNACSVGLWSTSTESICRWSVQTDLMSTWFIGCRHHYMTKYLHGDSPLLPWILHSEFINLNKNKLICVMRWWSFPVFLLGGCLHHISAKHHPTLSQNFPKYFGLLLISRWSAALSSWCWRVIFMSMTALILRCMTIALRLLSIQWRAEL